MDIIVPVSSNEPKSVIERSLHSILNLNYDSLNVSIIYVVDGLDEDDERVSLLRKNPVKVISRENNRGHRAGAINDVLDTIKDGDYIALFDVDSRPEPNFLLDCIEGLDHKNAVIASGPRYITNVDVNAVTKSISAEYEIMREIYRLFEWSDGFKQFNGLIGVIDANFLRRRKLDEEVSCEDVDLMQRIYLDGMTSTFVKSAIVGEQAPITWKDYYRQRLRWMTGAYEGLKRYHLDFIRSEIPMSRKITWFLSMTMPFFLGVFSPFVIVCALRLEHEDFKDLMTKSAGLFLNTWISMICGWNAILMKIRRKSVEWKKIGRTDA